LQSKVVLLRRHEKKQQSTSVSEVSHG